MNLQELITPLGKFLEWTFNAVLVPISNGFNWAVIVLGMFAICYWLMWQKKFSAKAKKDGTLV